MSDDAIKFEPLGFRSEASEPLCEAGVRAGTVPDPLTVEQCRDGGFLVTRQASFGAWEYRKMVFAAGTIEEVAEYLETAFS